MGFRIVLSFLILSIALNINAQNKAIEDLEIVEEDLPTGDVQIFAVYRGHCPVTLTIDFPELNNFKPSQSTPFQAVVQPNAEKQFLTLLKRIKKTKEASYGFGYSFVVGDAFNAKHDDDFAYLLPFPRGQKYLMGQGNNGRFSHRGVNAVDFNMPIGSKVAAARGGIVIDYREDSSKGCKSANCQHEANFLLIYHDDGSFSHYGHLDTDGVLVEIGEHVKAGQVIAKSGNTGWSSGPHLHFEVYIPQGSQQITLPVNFRLPNGKIGQLREGERYSLSVN